MIDKTAIFFEGFAKKLGISIKIPRPSKTMRMVSIVTNSTVGILLTIIGVLMSSLVFIFIGILGLAGAIMLTIDK